jgi:hypothetical protein
MDNPEQDRLLKFKRDMEKLGLSNIKSDEYVSPLNDAMMKFKGSKTSVDVTPAVNLVKGSGQIPDANSLVKGIADKIDTKSIQKQLSGSAFADKIQDILKSRAAAKLGGAAGDMIKKVPMIGGIAAGLGTLLTTGDASAASQAALPLVGDSDDLGSSIDSLEGKMEAGTATPDELYRLRNGLK